MNVIRQSNSQMETEDEEDMEMVDENGKNKINSKKEDENSESETNPYDLGETREINADEPEGKTNKKNMMLIQKGPYSFAANKNKMF